VMGSVDNHFSGTASGVNNAITRIANVFANAIFGALAVLFFLGGLQDHIKPIPLSAANKTAVIAQAANLGNAKAPPGIPFQTAKAIKTAYHESFIDAYASIMRISACLGFLGALMAVIFIRNIAVKAGNKP